MLSNIFSLLFVIFLGFSTIIPAECEQNMTKNENHISGISTSLSTLSRFITGLSVQWTFMRSSTRFQPILSDLLSISNSTVIPKMLNLDTEELSTVTDKVISVITKTELEDHLNISGIKRTIETYQNISLRRLKNALDHPNLQNLQNSSDVFRSKLRNLSSVITDKTPKLKLFTDTYYHIMENPTISDYSTAESYLEILQTNYKYVRELFTTISTDKDWIDGFLSPDNDTVKSLESLAFLCEIADHYHRHKLSKAVFSPLLSQIDKVKWLISDNQKIDTSIGLELQELAYHLLSPDATDKESIDSIFKDLGTDEWLRSLINYKKSGLSDQLIRALSPLEKFLELLKPVQKTWRVIKDDKEMIRNLMRVGKILEFREIDKLGERMSQSIMCVEDLELISDNDTSVIREFQEYYKEFGRVGEELKKLQRVIKMISSDNDTYQAVISYYFSYYNSNDKNGNWSERQDWKEKVQEQYNATRIKISTDQLSLIRYFTDKMKKINTTLLSTSKSFISDFDEIPEIIRSTNFITGLTCFQNISTDNETDNNYITKFQAFLNTLSAFKKHTNSAFDFTTFLNDTDTFISQTDKLLKESVIRMLSNRGQEERKILMMKVAYMVALGLSAGTRVIRDISKVWEHRDKLQHLLNTKIDKVIRDKIGQLIRGVINLNVEAGEMRSSRDPMDVFEIFELALNISGAPINISDPEVISLGPFIKDLPPLKLDFSNEKTDLESGLESRELINEFLDDLSGITDKESLPLISDNFYIGISVVGLVILITMGACAFVLYSAKKDARK